MREIKFRGKRIDNGEWICGGICSFPDGRIAILQYVDIGKQYADYHFQIIPETVGQYTGLHDKNGKEIYEWDIIELVNADLERIKVLCEFGSAKRDIYGNVVEIIGFYFRILPKGRKTFPVVNNYIGKHDTEIFEIIGNIHENPELLGVLKC